MQEKNTIFGNKNSFPHMTIQERIHYLIQSKTINVKDIKELSSTINVPYTSLKNALDKNNNELNTKYCLGIEKKFMINLNWLISGEGNIFNKADIKPDSNIEKIENLETEISLLKGIIYDAVNKGHNAKNEIKILNTNKPEIRSLTSKNKDTYEVSNIKRINPVSAKRKEKIPKFLSKLCAGNGSHVEDYIDEMIDLNEKMIPNPRTTFLCKIFGDSMMYSGIYDGDEVVIDTNISPKQNDIVLAQVGDEFTCKRLSKVADKMVLRPENYHYPDIEVTENVKIIGVVTFCIKQLK